MHPCTRATFAAKTGITECPFLYQTRTILRHNSIPGHARLVTSTTSATRKKEPRSQKDSHEPSIETPSEPSFLKQKAARITSSKPRLGPTITAAEQAAFDSICALFKKPAPSTTKARATSTNHADTDYKNILELFSSSPQHTHDFSPDNSNHDGIADGELASQAEFESTSTAESILADRTSAKLPIQTQPQLSRESAMAEIQGFLKDTTSPAALSPSVSDPRSAQTTQSTALAIVEDVADSLTNALASRALRPDLAMWKVAEEKIFPLIQLLRPSTAILSSPLPADQTSSQSQPRLHPLVPPNLPLLPILTQTYPSLTLLLLRLYVTHHPTSPYALALLPTLKSLGPTSYVLGAHTHFYNTLLSLSWRIYSDLRGMNALLAEMEANGVEFDIGTWEAMKMVGEDRARDLDGLGERGEAWWDRMEQRVWWQRVGIQWREVIKRRLDEKGLSTGEVMREGHVGPEMNTDHVDKEYVVTL